MKKSRVNQALFGISLICFTLFSISFILMPIKTCEFSPGVFFWGGIMMGTVLQIVLRTRRRAQRASSGTGCDEQQKKRKGFLTFGSSLVTVIFDIAFICSVLGAAFAYVITKGAGIICYALISVAVFSFCMHCAFNSGNYSFLVKQTKGRRLLTEKIHK